MSALDMLMGLYFVCQLFAIGACAVMSGTRRSSRPWYFATKMLWWSTVAGITNLACAAAVILLSHV